MHEALGIQIQVSSYPRAFTLIIYPTNSNICSCDFKCSLWFVISRKQNALFHPGLTRNIVYFCDLSEFCNCEKNRVLVAFVNSGN